MQSIQLTPNYEAMFRSMLDEAARQAQASRMFDFAGATIEVQALRSVQRWFAPLAIAANSATSAADVERLRDVMAAILTDLNQTATEIESDLYEDAAFDAF